MFRRLVPALVLLLGSVVPAQALGTSGDGERVLGPNGASTFLIGLNYEGPADRAWQMWDNGKFDAGLIDADFGRAVAAGATSLRLFVQAPLAVEIAAGNWDKLDQVLGLAEKRNLGLIVSLHDYGERDLARVSKLAGQIAERYRGRKGILLFDLKNEPRFGDLSLAKYTSAPPLQQAGLVDRYGERLARGDLVAYRASDEGRQTVPSYLSDDEAYVYVNNLRLYREMVAEAGAWVRERQFKPTTLDYLDDPAGAKWSPLIQALNGTLEAWLAPQVLAIHAADPMRPVTVDHVDAILARLPANEVLDVQTLHRYPGTGAPSIRANLNLLRDMRSWHPGKPIVLGEFGYATETVDPARAAVHETAILLGLVAQHAAGGAKWMLNDMPTGFNMRERTLGAYRLDGSPKPVVGAMAALRAYLDASGSAPGDLRLDDEAGGGLRFTYRASDALLLGGTRVDAGSVAFQASGPAHLFLTWTEPNAVRVWASAPLKASVNLADLPTGSAPSEPRLTHLEGSEERAVPIGAREGAKLTLDLQAGSYVLRLGPPTSRAADYDLPNGHFFSQTNGREQSAAGFAVTNADGVPFWDAFRTLGGVDVLGYPVSRRFEMDGFMVQAFQKTILQFRPDQDGRFAFVNTFDVLHDHGRDDWLETYRQTPRPLDTSPDSGLAFEAVMARHLAMLDGVPAPIKERFLSDPQWLDHYGLPVAAHEYPTSIVVRAQRATFQYWKEAVPWAAKGSITIANGGDLAKEAGLFPWLAAVPDNAPR